MRIADHAVAMQSSHALQQPSHAAHQQQVLSPEAARAAAEVEAQRHAKQVAESDKSENPALRNEERGGKNSQDREGDPAHAPNDGSDDSAEPMKGAPEPGKGERLDLLA